VQRALGRPRPSRTGEIIDCYAAERRGWGPCVDLTRLLYSSRDGASSPNLPLVAGTNVGSKVTQAHLGTQAGLCAQDRSVTMGIFPHNAGSIGDVDRLWDSVAGRPKSGACSLMNNQWASVVGATAR
jgi:hypothetical protein